MPTAILQQGPTLATTVGGRACGINTTRAPVPKTWRGDKIHHVVVVVSSRQTSYREGSGGSSNAYLEGDGVLHRRGSVGELNVHLHSLHLIRRVMVFKDVHGVGHLTSANP